MEKKKLTADEIIEIVEDKGISVDSFVMVILIVTYQKTLLGLKN